MRFPILLLSAALPILASWPTSQAEEAPVRIELRGIRPGERISRPVTLEVRPSRKVEVVSFFLDDQLVRATDKSPYRWQLDPERWLRKDRQRTVKLSARALVRGELVSCPSVEVELVQPE